jgi:hypothetical protein
MKKFSLKQLLALCCFCSMMAIFLLYYTGRLHGISRMQTNRDTAPEIKQDSFALKSVVITNEVMMSSSKSIIVSQDRFQTTEYIASSWLYYSFLTGAAPPLFYPTKISITAFPLYWKPLTPHIDSLRPLPLIKKP